MLFTMDVRSGVVDMDIGVDISGVFSIAIENINEENTNEIINYNIHGYIFPLLDTDHENPDDTVKKHFGVDAINDIDGTVVNKKDESNTVYKITNINTESTIHKICSLKNIYETVRLVRPHNSDPSLFIFYCVCLNRSNIDDYTFQPPKNTTVNNNKHDIYIFLYTAAAFTRHLISNTMKMMVHANKNKYRHIHTNHLKTVYKYILKG